MDTVLSIDNPTASGIAVRPLHFSSVRRLTKQVAFRICRAGCLYAGTGVEHITNVRPAAGDRNIALGRSLPTFISHGEALTTCPVSAAHETLQDCSYLQVLIGMDAPQCD